MTVTIVDTPSIDFDPPRITPAPSGLFEAISRGDAWSDSGDGPNRASLGGVQVRAINYGAETSTGVWNAPWCGDPTPSDSTKSGARPEFPDPFEPIIVWAFDACDETDRSRAEVRSNARYWLDVKAGVRVERAFAERAYSDAPSLGDPAPLLEALGTLETSIGLTGVPAFIHVSNALVPFLVRDRVMRREKPDGPLLSPSGNIWVIGGGYHAEIGLALVATSQPYGWRDAPALTEAMYEPSDDVEGLENLFVSVAEQTFVVGYEKAIGRVSISDVYVPDEEPEP